VPYAINTLAEEAAATLSEASAQYAAVVAQVVPVLLLAAVAVPLRMGDAMPTRSRAFRDVLLIGLLMGAAVITEFAALFGVWQGGLTPADMGLLTWLVVVTAMLAVVRVVAPVARGYAEQSGIPAGRVTRILAAVAALSSVVLLLVFNSLTR
jgi:hypothetical protein